MRWIALTAAAATTAALLAAVVPAASAGAAEHCTAYGSLPARVALHGDRVVLRTVLKGSSACRHRPVDNGASAELSAPGTTTENLRWHRFGAAQTVSLYSALAKAGTYRISAGTVQVYDGASRRVDSSWHGTSTVVKWAARADGVTASAGRVGGRTVHSSKYGLVASRTLVHVQRRSADTTAWHTIGSVRPDAHGRLSYATPTSSAYAYRLVFHATKYVWGATSAQVRG